MDQRLLGDEMLCIQGFTNPRCAFVYRFCRNNDIVHFVLWIRINRNIHHAKQVVQMISNQFRNLCSRNRRLEKKAAFASKKENVLEVDVWYQCTLLGQKDFFFVDTLRAPYSPLNRNMIWALILWAPNSFACKKL